MSPLIVGKSHRFTCKISHNPLILFSSLRYVPELNKCNDSRLYDGSFDGGCLLMGEGAIWGSGVYLRLFRFGLFCLLSLKYAV